MADPSSPLEARTAAESRRRIDDEHRQLNERLAELVATREPERLAARLEELREALLRHFASEEAEDGLHEIVSRQAPHRLPNVDQLFAEHREIVRRLDRLRASAVELCDGPLARLLDGVGELAAVLRLHEAVEDEIFGEAFYTDIGGRA